MLSKLEYHQLPRAKRVAYNRSRSTSDLFKMQQEGYFGDYTLNNILKERGEFTEERKAEMENKHRKIARLMGQVAANVR